MRVKLSSVFSKCGSVQNMCPGYIPFFSVMQPTYVGRACCGQDNTCQSGRMVSYCSSGGRRRGRSLKFEGLRFIDVVITVGVRLVELIGTRSAWIKWMRFQ